MPSVITSYGAAHDSPTVRAAYAAVMNDVAREAIARLRTVKASQQDAMSTELP